MLFFMPHHLCKKLDVRLRTFLRESYTLPFLLSVPLVAALLLMQRWFVPHNYRQLGLQMLIAGTVYGLGVLWSVLTNQVLRVSELALSGSSAPALSMVPVPEEEEEKEYQRPQDV
jgi:hypothetical protein